MRVIAIPGEKPRHPERSEESPEIRPRALSRNPSLRSG